MSEAVRLVKLDSRPWTLPNAAASRYRPPNGLRAACHFQRVLGSRVELRGLLTDDIVLFATHCAGLDFEHQVILRKAFEQLCGDLEILSQREIAPVEHVTCEKIRPARGAPPLRFLDEREDKLVELVLQAMVGVHRDVDRLTLCGAMNVLGYRDCAERHVVN